MILDRFLEIVFVCVVWLIFLSKRKDRIDMPRRLVDDLEGEVIGEEFYKRALWQDILSADLDGEDAFLPSAQKGLHSVWAFIFLHRA